MSVDAETIGALAIFACGLGMGLAVFRPREATGLACWAILYLDDNAVMQRTQVRVLNASPLERRLVGWCSVKERERVFKISRIVEARDATTGLPVNVDRWLSHLEVRSAAHARPA